MFFVSSDNDADAEDDAEAAADAATPAFNTNTTIAGKTDCVALLLLCTTHGETSWEAVNRDRNTCTTPASVETNGTSAATADGRVRKSIQRRSVYGCGVG